MCITVVNCADDDKPLKYKYGYFVSKASFEEDVVQSLGGYNMQLLSDSSTFNEFVSNLMPGAFSNLLADYEPQIIMVSITDSLGGMTNLTRPLTVIPVTAARRR